MFVPFGCAAVLLTVAPGLPRAHGLDVAPNPTVTTDLLDYPPGATAYISGTGFHANEEVTLHVAHIDDTPEGGEGHDHWTVLTDDHGSFTAEWLVNPDDSLDSEFRLTAECAHGLHAETTFTDHLGHPVHTYAFETSGLDVATSITITGSRRISTVSSHPVTAFSLTFTSPGPSGGVVAIVSPPASTFTYSGFPSSVPDVCGDYVLVSTSPASPFSVLATGTTTIIGTYEFVPSDEGTPCGSDSDTDCDNPDTCDGAGNCQDNIEPATTVCRAAAGDCDVDEFCDGASDDCPADGKSTELCRAAAGDCDVNEFCDGGSDDCPVDGKSTDLCRAAAGDCDVDEFCDGASDDCPADAKFTDLCRASAGECDMDESCDGISNHCPADAKFTDLCRASAGECDMDESCDGVSNDCPADDFEPSGTACGDPTDTVCDNPDTCDGSGGCESNHEPVTTECRADAGECDVAEHCDGAGGCPADDFESAGKACGDGANTECDNLDTCDGLGACQDNLEPGGTACGNPMANQCTDADTCDGDGNCEPNNKPCGSLTSSHLCPFDYFPGEAGHQFKLLFTPDVQNWVSYKLNASNPGQFFYNLIVNGNPGDGVAVDIDVAYPFVTQGAMPVHVYDAGQLDFSAGGCFVPPDSALAAQANQLDMQDWTSGACTGAPVCGADGAGTCTITVNTTYPASGSLYINVHLDYGLKGMALDANICDSVMDRYDRGVGPGVCGGYHAKVNTADGSGVVALSNGKAYAFAHTDGVSANGDTVQGVNVFKPITGAFGAVESSMTGQPEGNGTPVALVRNSTGAVVKQGVVDEDGYYTLDYKHKGSPENYTVRILGAYNVSQVVVLKGNGWVEVGFDPATGTFKVIESKGTVTKQ